MICVECGKDTGRVVTVGGLIVCGECIAKVGTPEQVPQAKVIEVYFRKIVTKPTPERERR